MTLLTSGPFKYKATCEINDAGTDTAEILISTTENHSAFDGDAITPDLLTTSPASDRIYAHVESTPTGQARLQGPGRRHLGRAGRRRGPVDRLVRRDQHLQQARALLLRRLRDHLMRLRALIKRPSPAMIVALAALVMSLSGTTYAVTKLPSRSVGSTQLKKGAVRSENIAKGAVTTSKLALGLTAAGAKASRASLRADASYAAPRRLCRQRRPRRQRDARRQGDARDERGERDHRRKRGERRLRGERGPARRPRLELLPQPQHVRPDPAVHPRRGPGDGRGRRPADVVLRAFHVHGALLHRARRAAGRRGRDPDLDHAGAFGIRGLCQRRRPEPGRSGDQPVGRRRRRRARPAAVRVLGRRHGDRAGRHRDPLDRLLGRCEHLPQARNLQLRRFRRSSDPGRAAQRGSGREEQRGPRRTEPAVRNRALHDQLRLFAGQAGERLRAVARGGQRDPVRGRREAGRALGPLPLHAALGRVPPRALRRAQVARGLQRDGDRARARRGHLRLPARARHELRPGLRARPRRDDARRVPLPPVGGIEHVRARGPPLRAGLPRARVDRLRGHRRQHRGRAARRRPPRGRALGARLGDRARARRSLRRAARGGLERRTGRPGAQRADRPDGRVDAFRAAPADIGEDRVPEALDRPAPLEVRRRDARLDRLVAHRRGPLAAGAARLRRPLARRALLARGAGAAGARGALRAASVPPGAERRPSVGALALRARLRAPGRARGPVRPSARAARAARRRRAVGALDRAAAGRALRRARRPAARFATASSRRSSSSGW